MTKTKSKKQKRNSEKPYNFYGIRETRNPKYMSVTLVREDEDGERHWINVPVNFKNIKVGGNDIYLKLKLLSTSEDEDEDEVDYNEVANLKSIAKPKSNPKSKPKKSKDDDEDEELPF